MSMLFQVLPQTVFTLPLGRDIPLRDVVDVSAFDELVIQVQSLASAFRPISACPIPPNLAMPNHGALRRAGVTSDMSAPRAAAPVLGLLACALAAFASPQATASPADPVLKVVAVDIPWPRGGGPWQDRGYFRELAWLQGQVVLFGRAERAGYPGAGTAGLLQLRDGRSGARLTYQYRPEIDQFDLFASAPTGGGFIATGRDDRGARAYVGRLTSSPRPSLALTEVTLPSEVTFSGGQFAAVAPSGDWLILGMHGPYRNGEEIVPLQTRLISGRRSLGLAARDLPREDGWRIPSAVGLSREGFVIAGTISTAHGSPGQGWILGVDTELRVTFELRGCGPRYLACSLLAVARSSRGGYEVAGFSSQAPAPGYFFARLSEEGEWLDDAPLSLPPGGPVKECSIEAMDDGAGAGPVFSGTCIAAGRESGRLDLRTFLRDTAGVQRWDPPWLGLRHVWEAKRDREGMAILVGVDTQSPSRRRQRLLLRAAQSGQVWPRKK